jgi:hypothetical protein
MSGLYSEKYLLKKRRIMFCFRLFSILFLSHLIINGSSCPPSTLSHQNTSSAYPYKMDINGDTTQLKSELISTEYNTYLISTKDNVRDITFGGAANGYSSNQLSYLYLTSSAPDFSAQRITIGTTNNWWNNMHNYFGTFQLGGINFDYILPEYEVYDASVSVQDTVNEQYVSRGTKTFNILLAGPNARDYNLDIIEQNSYRVFSDNDIDTASIREIFAGMNINLLCTLHTAVPDSIISPYNDTSTYLKTSDPLIKYVAMILYPTLTEQNAVSSFINNNKDRGVLVFVKNATIPATKFGKTITYLEGTTVHATASYIFSNNIDNAIDVTWRYKYYKANAVHELGHQWCINLASNSSNPNSHQYWHNGANRKECVMNSPLVYNSGNGIPDDSTQKILNLCDFCAGHKQRMMNVSWKIGAYLADQLPTSLYRQNSNIYAYSSKSQVGFDSGEDVELQISVSMPDVQFLKGKAIDILITAKNISDHTVEFYPSSLRESLVLLENGEELRNAVNYSPDNLPVMLRSGEEYYLYSDPAQLTNNSKKYTVETMRNAQLDEGNYKYRAGFVVGENIVWSDSFSFRVIPVPDSMKSVFDEYMTKKRNISMRRYDLSGDIYPEIPDLKHDYYDKEYLNYILTYTSYYEALEAGGSGILYKRASDLVEKYILKYPNTNFSSGFFQLILTYRKSPGNNELLSRIVNKMTSDTTDKVIENNYKRFIRENKRDILKVLPKLEK